MIAANTSMREKLYPEFVVSSILFPVEFKVVPTAAEVKTLPCNNLLNCCNKATTPAACGVAIDVPEQLPKAPPGAPQVPPTEDSVEIIPTPGANNSNKFP